MKTRYNIQAIIRNKKGLIMSVGHNNYIKSHPLQAHFAKLAKQPNKIYLHAEIEACIRAGLGAWIPEYPYSIDIERKDKQGNLRNAKPCPICVLAMEAFGIKIVNYTTDKGWVYGKTVEELKNEYRSDYTND